MSSAKWRPFRLGLNVLRYLVDVAPPPNLTLFGISAVVVLEDGRIIID